MAITYCGADYFSGTTGTSHSFYSGLFVKDDILILASVGWGASSDITFDHGTWTKVGDYGQYGRVYICKLDAAYPNITATYADLDGQSNTFILAGYRGASGWRMFNLGDAQASQSATHLGVAAPDAQATDLVIQIAGTAQTTGDPKRLVSPSSWARDVDYRGTGENGHSGLAIASKLGATDVPTWSVDPSSNRWWNTGSISLIAGASATTKTQAVTWNIYERAQKDQASSWDVLMSQSLDASAVWNVAASESLSISPIWDISEQMEKTQAVTWDITSTRQSKSVDIRWDIANRLPGSGAPPAVRRKTGPGWRVHAMNIVTRKWIHRDVRMTDLQLTWTVSGACEISGTINPDQPDYLDAGKSIFQQWQTALFVEADDVLRIGGIISDLEYTGPELAITAVGFSGAIQGQMLWDSITYGGTAAGKTGNGVDPMTVVRDIWAGIQSRERGNLGVTVSAPTTPYRLGTWHNAQNPDDKNDTNATDIEINRVWDDKTDKKPTGIVKAPSSKSKTASGIEETADVYWDYQLNWWDSIDAGAKIDELAKQVPFDYLEHYDWTGADKSDVSVWIEFGYPRLGSKKTNPVLIEGENVTEVVAISGDTDDYANSVWYLGAGDGKDQIRGVAQIDDGRVKRSVVITDTSITTKAAAEAAAKTELARRNKIENITSLSVMDHPNARVGSFAAGDDIRVKTHLGWNPQDLWCRVTSIALTVDTGEMSLTTARSDSFSYSAGSTT